MRREPATKRLAQRSIANWVLATLALALPAAAASPPSLLDILSEELQRNFSVLKEKADPPPYYMAYTVTEEESQGVSASFGTVNGENRNRARFLDITIRVGSPKLDNYHVVQGQRPRFTPERSFRSTTCRTRFAAGFGSTDRTYRLAARRLIEIKSNEQVKVKAADDSADFSIETPEKYEEPPVAAPYPGSGG